MLEGRNSKSEWRAWEIIIRLFSKGKTLKQCYFKVGPESQTLNQHCFSVLRFAGYLERFVQGMCECWDSTEPALWQWCVHAGNCKIATPISHFSQAPHPTFHWEKDYSVKSSDVTQWKQGYIRPPYPILYSVKLSDVTRWKQGYIRPLPHT